MIGDITYHSTHESTNKHRYHRRIVIKLVSLTLAISDGNFFVLTMTNCLKKFMKPEGGNSDFVKDQTKRIINGKIYSRKLFHNNKT